MTKILQEAEVVIEKRHVEEKTKTIQKKKIVVSSKIWTETLTRRIVYYAGMAEADAIRRAVGKGNNPEGWVLKSKRITVETLGL